MPLNLSGNLVSFILLGPISVGTIIMKEHSLIQTIQRAIQPIKSSMNPKTFSFPKVPKHIKPTIMLNV